MTSRKRRVKHASIVDAFAERLRSIRASRRMTQRELADKATITLSYISRLESGGAAPGIDLVERLAKALRVETSDLLPGSGPPQTIEAYRVQVGGLFDTVLLKAGQETLSMLTLFLVRLAESPAVNR